MFPFESLVDANNQDLLDAHVEPVSLVSGIAERVRQAVINGTLRPGDEINESQLAERLGVARSTLREAVRILIGEGLLEKQPNRTSRVRTLTAETAWEIMTMRAVIEGFGARVLAQRLTPEKIQRLNVVWEQMYRSAEAKDIPAFHHWDYMLHQAIMKLSGHGLLFETWTRISAWIRLMFASQQHEVEDLIPNAMDHKAVIEAIASADPDTAESRLKADLLQQRELARFAGLADIVVTAQNQPAAAAGNDSPER